MKLFKQRDEMHSYIDLKSIKIPYWFTVISLLIWAIIDLIQDTRYNMALLLVCLQNLFYGFYMGYFKRHARLNKSKNKVKCLREELKLTQDELAENLGISKETINAIENNKYTPSLELAIKIGQFFNLPVEELFTFNS